MMNKTEELENRMNEMSEKIQSHEKKLDEVYKVDRKSFQHMEYDILQRLQLYRNIAVHMIGATALPMNVTALISGILAAVSFLIVILTKPTNPLAYSIPLIAITICITTFISGKIVYHMGFAMAQHTTEDIVESGLRDYDAYEKLTDTEKESLIKGMQLYGFTKDHLKKVSKEDM